MGFEMDPQSEVRGTDMHRECAQELKPTQTHTFVPTEADTGIESLRSPLSSAPFSKLLGTTAMLLRAVRRFKYGRRGVQPTVHIVEERKQAETLWVSVQQSLANLKNLTKQFNLFRDEHGVWPCGTHYSLYAVSSTPTCIL